MSITYGTCPSCSLEKRLTAQRRVVASHIAKGAKCPGSGLEPTGVTRTMERSAETAPRRSPRLGPASAPAEAQGQANVEAGPKRPKPLNAVYAGVLTVLSGFGAVALGSNGHHVLGPTAFVLALLFAGVTWSTVRKLLMTPEELRAREDTLRYQRERRQREAREARRQELGPPPAGAVPPSPSAAFLRLNQHRFRGLGGGPTAALVCGRCAHNYRLPMSLVREYRLELSPGAALRRLNNPAVAMRQNMAQLNLRCPRCGSVDPGVWIEI